ncbi:MAG: YfbM family protein [Pseudomonadota bacterium]|nr:YfbM family protein [Pseudomonadota bacterium]
MGMIACFTSLAPTELQHLRDTPDEIEEFLYPDDGDSEPPNYMDLDKAWHGMHYLLTGTADEGQQPLSLAVVGGVEFGPEVGYGAARFLTPDQVAAIAIALADVTVDDLKQRFDPADMEAKQIYPDVIWTRDGSEGLDYVLDVFPSLQAFYAGAAERGEAAILWIA